MNCTLFKSLGNREEQRRGNATEKGECKREERKATEKRKGNEEEERFKRRGTGIEKREGNIE